MSKDQDEELIWKFLDGDLTRSEADQIEEKLELEESFRRQMADIRDLDNLLSARTAALPSMRFTTNVMERVTEQVATVMDYFQLPRRFARWYFTSLAGMLAVVLIIGLNLSSDGNLSSESVQIIDMVSTYTSTASAMLFFQVSIGLAGLFTLDFFLRRKYAKVSGSMSQNG